MCCHVSTVSSEIFHAEQKLTQMTLQLDGLKAEKEKVESKAAQLVGVRK